MGHPCEAIHIARCSGGVFHTSSGDMMEENRIRRPGPKQSGSVPLKQIREVV
jgi:hypothetical protein